MTGHVATPSTHIPSELERVGWCYVAGSELLAWLAFPPSSWAAFAETWDDLDRDRFMGDGGRYRYRRHASFTLAAGATLARNAHRPHAQAVEFNRLNGGIERWFSPIAPPIADGPIMRGFVSLCTGGGGVRARRGHDLADRSTPVPDRYVGRDGQADA